MQVLKTKLMASQLTKMDGEVLFKMLVQKGSADVGSDHYRMVVELKMRLVATKKGKNLRRRYDVGTHKSEDRGWEFQLKLLICCKRLDNSLGKKRRDED